MNDCEFLLWSIDELTTFGEKCELCNKRDGAENDTNTNTNMNEKSKKSSKCSNCDDCDDLLEQFFNCLLGYKTKTSARYLITHSVNSQALTLENAVNFYKHYKLPKLPEYDDLAKKSIPSEVIFCIIFFFSLIQIRFSMNFFKKFNEKLTEIIRLVQSQKEIEFDLDEFVYESFKQEFEKENPSEAETVFESIRRYSSVPKVFEPEIFYLLGDYNFKNEKDESKKFSKAGLVYFIQDLAFNEDRFDSWACLALTKSSCTLNDYLENVCLSDLNRFI